VAELELQLDQSKKSLTRTAQQLATATMMAGGAGGGVQQLEDMQLQMEVGERKLREMTKL
jgi:hypothetical protein